METLGTMTGLNGTRRMHDTSQFDRHELSNGLVVWLQKPTILTNHKGYLAVTFNGVGSNADPCGLEGLAHFVEHMLFCGSKSRKTRKELTGPIADKGGGYNAFTDEYHTQYHITLCQNEFAFAAETLFEILDKPLFDLKHFQSEKNVIIQEFQRDTRAGEGLFFRHALEFLFGKKHPSSRCTVGFPASIKRITLSDIRSFFTKYYHTGNAQIICGGSFSFREDALGILENVFSKMRCAPPNPMPIKKIIRTGGENFYRKDARYKKDALDIAYILPKISVKDFITIDFILVCIGSGDSSPLFTELRTKRGLIYSFSIKIKEMVDETMIDFYAVIKSEHFMEAEGIFFETLKNLQPEEMIENMRKLQLSRLNKFYPPIEACEDLWHELMVRNRTYSADEEATIRDDLTVEDVLSWRNQLLEMKPIVMHFTA